MLDGMTNIKASEVLKELKDYTEDLPHYSPDEIAEALEMANKALEQARWIPVSERLPEPNVAVLTYINTGATETYCLAYWNNVSEAWEEWIGYDLIEKDKGYKVIAWRELPEPY